MDQTTVSAPVQKGVPFTPQKLPVSIPYADLVESITQAHRSLTRLDEMLLYIHNPSHLERTFFTQEAVLSSKIEGTQVTLDEVMQNDASGSDTDETDEKRKDFREVLNYRRAIRDGMSRIKDGQTLSENVVKHLHALLLDSTRGKDKQPGQFRSEQVHIGPKGTPMSEARYVPPAPLFVNELYGNLDRYMNTEELEKDPLVQIAIAHYQFEAIHPFKDGNGRVGRMLIPLFLYERGILSRPLIYISKYFEEHRRDYYDLLNDVSYKDAWVPWIRFFLQGVHEQAVEATLLGKKIIALREKYRGRLSEFHSTYAHAVIDALFERPYFTTTQLKEAAQVKTLQSVLTLVEKFVSLGIIADISPHMQRNKVYRFTELTELLEQN